MMWPEVDWTICKMCQPCEARWVCKTRAVVQIDDDEPTIIDLTRCNGCGLCLDACPFGAIVMRSAMTVQGAKEDEG